MMALVQALNVLLTGLFDLLCRPLAPLPPVAALTILSVLTGILMLLVFGRVSNQAAIGRVRDRIRGHLIGVRLFQHDLGVVGRLQGRILADTGRYLRHSLLPMLILIPPVILVIIQLNLRFAVRPLRPGESAMLQALTHEPTLLNSISAEAGDGLLVETPPVRIASRGEVAWRIRAETPGAHVIRLTVAGHAVEKQVVVGERALKVPALRPGPDFLAVLLYPGERPLPEAAGLASVRLQYPPLPLPFLGWELNWLVAFFVLTILSGFAFKGALGVEI